VKVSKISFALFEDDDTDAISQVEKNVMPTRDLIQRRAEQNKVLACYPRSDSCCSLDHKKCAGHHVLCNYRVLASAASPVSRVEQQAFEAKHSLPISRVTPKG
jgi:hypothetical protein